MSTAARDREIISERAQGLSLRAIGKRHNLSHETVRGVLLRKAQQHVDNLEELLRGGYRITLEVCGDDRALSLWLDLILKCLTRRGVRVAATYGPDGQIDIEDDDFAEEE